MLRSKTAVVAGTLTFVLLCCVVVVIAHDDPNHEADALPPYDGEGYNAATGGFPGMEFPAQGVHLLSWIPVLEFGEFNSANDCWGYVSPSGREYAVIGLSGGTAFVEVTNPGEPQIIEVIPGPQSQWRDIKTYGQYAYAVTEGSSPAQALQVIDLTQIDDGIVTHINTINEGGTITTPRTHNVAINEDSGYLYRVGGASGSIGLRIYDLADPANPVFVAQWHDRYAHDAQIVTYTEGPYAGREIAFLASNNASGGGNPGLDILDVTDKNDIIHLGFTNYSWPGYSHQSWLNEDRTLLYLNDELGESTHHIPTTTRVINVSDLTNPFEVSTYTNGLNSIGHNIYIRDNLIYAANYRSGLRIFDTSDDPLAPVEIAYFDTFPATDSLNFNGLWSTYPYFPSGVVIGSDIEKGLFVWWVGDMPLAFEYPEGLPELIKPAGESLQVRIATLNGQSVLPGSAKFHFDAGDGETTIDLVHVEDDVYEAIFPSLPCGTPVNWYVSAKSASGLTLRDPPTAPVTQYTAIAAFDVQVVFSDTFESDLGWSVGAADDNATGGIWERVDPIGTVSGAMQVQPDGPYVGTACYVTGQHPGGSAGVNDVDNGKTTLFSPVFDLSGAQEANISYWRWYSNHAGTNPQVDVFIVEISSDGKTWVNVETVGPDGPQTMGGWYRHEFAVSPLVDLTRSVQLRFIASDEGLQALVEAAVDALDVQFIDCDEPCEADIAGGDGVVDVTDLLAVLATWGECPQQGSCSADFNHDNTVDVSDLLILLSAWGTCE